MESPEKYVCLTCKATCDKLYTVSDSGLIKMNSCESCHNTVDKYIECERSTVILDAMLQEPAAYTHILHNSSAFSVKFYRRLAFLITMCETHALWQTLPLVHDGQSNDEEKEFYIYICFFWAVIGLSIYCATVIFILKSFLSYRKYSKIMKAIIVAQSAQLLQIPASIYGQYTLTSRKRISFLCVIAGKLLSIFVISVIRG